MIDQAARSEVVLALAEEFLERYRKGERPRLKEYIDRQPELSTEIRENYKSTLRTVTETTDSTLANVTIALPPPVVMVAVAVVTS